MKVKKTVLIWLKHVRFIRAQTTVALPQTSLAFVYFSIIHLFISCLFGRADAYSIATRKMEKCDASVQLQLNVHVDV